MARNKEFLEDDFDFDLDMDFDFPGSKTEPPPKNAREAVTRTFRDAYKGAKDELLQNPSDQVLKALDAGMPRSLRSEYADLKESFGSVKSATSDAIKEIQKEGQSLARQIGKLAPEGSKFKKLMDKLSGPQGEVLRGPSKEQQQSDEINTAILTALGAQHEQSQVQESIRNAMEEKRSATMATLLQSIYAEVKMERTFTYKITNSYYRKSLEIQLKQLYTQKELLELTRTNYANFKIQFENIVRNTGLPDIIKLRSAEQIKADFSSRARKEMIDSLYKNFNPMNAITKKMTGKVKEFQEAFVQGFQMMSMGLDSGSAMDGMGMSKGMMAGGLLAEWGRNMLMRMGGDKLSKTKAGKKAIYNAKSALMDPNAFIREMAGKKRKGKLGGMQDSFWGFLNQFTGAAEKNKYSFTKQNLDDAQIFDGRAHQAIVKVIPGLLSKIHAEIKATRLGGDAKQYELAWDNKTDGFSTTAQMAKNATKDIKRSFASSANYYAGSFTNMLQEHGGKLSPVEISSVNKALVQYLLNNKSSLSPTAIASNKFLNNIQDPKVRAKIKKYAVKILKESRNNPDILDDIQFAFSGIRRAMPSPSGYMDDFNKSGNMDAAIKMGLASKTKNGYHYNEQALNEMLIEAMGEGYKTKGPKEAQKTLLEKSIAQAKDKMKNFYTDTKSKVVGAAGARISSGKQIWEERDSYIANAKIRSRETLKNVKRAGEKLKNMDKESAVSFFNSTKLKADDLINEQVVARMSPSQKSQAENVIRQIQSVSKKTEDKTVNLISAAGNTAIASEISKVNDVVQDRVKDFIEFASKNGYNKKAFDKYLKEVKAASEQFKTELEEKNYSSAADVMMKSTTGKTKKEWEEKAKAKAGQLSKKGMKIIKEMMNERSLEDLKKEYFESVESKKEDGPNFQEWMQKMGYRAKGDTLKKIREKTFALDRKMAKFLITLPFKVVKGAAKLAWKGKGLPFKGIKGASKLAGSIAGGIGSQSARLVKDMFVSAEKNGGQAAASAAAQMTQVTTSVMSANAISEMATAMQAKLNEGDGTKRRKGSWMDKLNLFNKDGKDNTEKNVKEGSKKGPLWMILGIVGGVFGFVKKMFSGIGSLVKWVKKGVGFLFKLPGMLIKGIGGAIKGLGSMLSSAGGTVANAAKGAWDWVKDKAGKLKDGAKNLVSKGADAVKSGASKVSEWSMKLIRAVVPDKVIKAAETAMSKLKGFGSKFKRFFSALGRIAKKLGGSIAKAIAKFVAKYVVSSGTGIGVLLAAGFAAWDVGWILKYWIVDDMSLGNAICKQLLDIEPFGKGENAEPDPFTEDGEGEGLEDSRKDYPTPAASGTSGGSGTSVSTSGGSAPGVPTAINYEAQVANAYQGAAGKGNFETPTKVDASKYNTSPYIKPNMQKSTGTPADILGLKPEFRKRVEGFAKDYYQFTGKKLEINSANRSLEDQVKMWEKESKVKWTNNRAKDEAATRAAGGKFYNFLGGTVAYPNPTPSIPGHTTGEAVDLNIGAMPNQAGINDVNRTPWLDDMLEKWGLHRPLTAFKGHKGRRERWHIAAMKGAGPVPESEPQPVETDSLKGKDKSDIQKDAQATAKEEAASSTPSAPSVVPGGGAGGSVSIASIGANSNYGGGTSTTSAPSMVNSAAVSTATSASAGMAAASSYAGSSSPSASAPVEVTKTSETVASGGSYTELLAKQLEVQTQSMNILREIKEQLANGGVGGDPASKSDLGGQPGTSDFPGMAVSLKRKVDYA